MKKSIHVEPFIALLHTNERAISFACPDASDDRFQAHTMLIHRPDFHLGVRMGVLDLSDLFWQLALEQLLLDGVGFVVTRTGHLEREAQPLEILPAALGVDRAPGSPTHPLGDLWASPQAAISWSLLKDSL